MSDAPAAYEYQLKVHKKVSEESLYSLGAKKIGSVYHEDRYFIAKTSTLSDGSELIRMRKEGGEELVYTYKGPIANKKIRNRLVISRPIDEREALTIKNEYKEIVSVNKRRITFLLNSVLISLDSVERMGEYIEFDIDKEENTYLINAIAEKLGIDINQATKLSYFEIALLHRDPLNRFLDSVHRRFGTFIFGMSSAVLTTLGIIVGLNATTASRIAIIGGIASVAVSDSLSDSISTYASHKTERGTSPKTALRKAINVWIGKVIFTSSFMVPFLLLSTTTALYVCIAWASFLVFIVGMQIAYIEEKGIVKNVLESFAVLAVTIGLSYTVGRLISNL